MHPLSNTREGLIRIPAAVANLTPGLVAKIDSNGKAALAGASYAPVAGRYVVVDGDSITASLLPIEPGRQVRVLLDGDCNPGEELAVTVDSKAIRKADTTGLSSVLVAEEAGVAGQMVLARGIAAYVEPTPPDELPAIATGDAGKALTVKSDESGVEWAPPGGLPDHAGHADGELLGLTGGNPAWRAAPNEVPSGGNPGDVLTVGTVPEWQAPPAPTVAQLEAIVALLPTSNPYEAGKLYVDGDLIKISAGI